MFAAIWIIRCSVRCLGYKYFALVYIAIFSYYVRGNSSQRVFCHSAYKSAHIECGVRSLKIQNICKYRLIQIKSNWKGGCSVEDDRRSI